MARLQLDMCHSGANFLAIYTGHFRLDEIGESLVWLARSDRRVFRIGWGLLNVQDFTRIARLLREDELIILVSEREMFNPSVFPTEEQRQVPPVDFVTAKCHYIIAPGRLLVVVPFADPQQKQIEIRGATFDTLPRHRVDDFIRHEAAIPAIIAAA